MICTMKAAILAVGSELLGTERLDTNSLALAALLERFGVDLIVKSVIGDDEQAIADELSARLKQVDLVLMTGGLGPTEDDRTRAATAQALGRGLQVDEDWVEHIRKLFASFGRVMPEVNRRQAEVIDGAEMLENRRGSAPGQKLEHDGRFIFLFPGVPRELKGMMADHLEPFLAERAKPGSTVERRTLRVACLPESEVEQRIKAVYKTYGRDAIAVLASPGDIRVQGFAKGTAEERAAVLDPMMAELRRAIGPAVYGEGDQQLEEVVGELLKAASMRVVTAESCTGGLIAERLTRTPGSSAWLEGGFVTYSYGLKTLLLGVKTETLETWGAVSEQVVVDMARGALSRCRSELAIAVSGIAGPGGATDEKPVGTVHFALAGPGEDDVEHRQVIFPGDREQVRRMTSQMALDMIRRKLLDLGAELTAGLAEETSP